MYVHVCGLLATFMSIFNINRTVILCHYFICRPIDVSGRSLLFEHYMHPCIANNASNIAVSRYLLPFGLQGFEFSVTSLVVCYSLLKTNDRASHFYLLKIPDLSIVDCYFATNQRCSIIFVNCLVNCFMTEEH